MRSVIVCLWNYWCWTQRCPTIWITTTGMSFFYAHLLSTFLCDHWWNVVLMNYLSRKAVFTVELTLFCGCQRHSLPCIEQTERSCSLPAVGLVLCNLQGQSTETVRVTWMFWSMHVFSWLWHSSTVLIHARLLLTLTSLDRSDPCTSSVDSDIARPFWSMHVFCWLRHSSTVLIHVRLLLTQT